MPASGFLCLLVILGIACDGAAHMRQLHADLMMAAGIQPDIQFCPWRIIVWRLVKKERSLFYNGIMKTGKFGSCRAGSADAGSVGAPILYEIVLQRAFFLRGMAIRQSTVIFSKAMALQLAV